MNHGYSFWASTAGGDSTLGPRRIYARYGSKTVADNFVPSPLMLQIARENFAFLEKVAEQSSRSALSVWLGAVSGKALGGNKEASKAAGALDQPDWDYLMINWKNYGDLEQREALGNFNYGATGYFVGMKQCREVGIPDSICDSLLRPILRGGGGGYQWWQDKVYHEPPPRIVDTVWYQEERKDVPPIEAGMDYAQFYFRRKDAEELGITLDPRDFGFPADDDDPKSSIIDYEIKKEMGLEKLMKQVKEEIDRIEKEAKDRRLRQERELKRQREEGQKKDSSQVDKGDVHK